MLRHDLINVEVLYKDASTGEEKPIGTFESVAVDTETAPSREIEQQIHELTAAFPCDYATVRQMMKEAGYEKDLTEKGLEILSMSGGNAFGWEMAVNAIRIAQNERANGLGEAVKNGVIWNMVPTLSGEEFLQQMRDAVAGGTDNKGQRRFPRPYGMPYCYKPHRKPKKKPGRKKRRK